MNGASGGVKQSIVKLRVAGIALLALLASGCDRAVILNPKGPIADAERGLLIDAFTVMMIVVIPVIFMALLFAWRYRAGRNARYEPTWAYSAKVDAVVWLVPALIVIAVAVLLWRSTHKLDPYREIASSNPPLDVQVVAQDWKWLFIYPEQGVASVNRLAVPAGTPLHFSITSASVMNSFFVPQLGSQIYAMAGMATNLMLQADTPGTYAGLSAQYSGGGFSDMRFEVIALEPAAFEDWVRQTKAAGNTLDFVAYTRLVRPSSAVPPATFGEVAPDLFEAAIHRAVR